MFTTYFLYNGETERLKLEFDNFNKNYYELRRKFNQMMNKPDDTEGNAGGGDSDDNNINICQTVKMWRLLYLRSRQPAKNCYWGWTSRKGWLLCLSSEISLPPSLSPRRVLPP